MNIRIKIRKYGLKVIGFLFLIYINSFLDKIFEPLNEYLINTSKTFPVLKILDFFVSILALEIPIYSLLIALSVIWIVFKIYLFVRVRRNKLQILTAIYGKNSRIVEITNQLNNLVENDKLKVVLSNALAGDPLYGKPKMGKVKYQYNGKISEKEYIEGETIELP